MRPSRLPTSALRVAALVAGLVLVASPVHARASIAEDEHALEVARAAFDVGLEAYRDGDYPGAVEAWTSAHRLILLAVDDVEMERVLGFDLAQAHLQVYASDRDPKHLAVARTLLEDYILWIERPGHAITTEDRPDLDRAHELLAIVEIDQAAAIADRHANPYPPGWWPPPPPRPRRTHADVPPPPEPLRRQRRESTTWIVIGTVGLGVGVVFATVTGVLARDDRPSNKTGLAFAATMTAVGGVVGATGLTIGLLKHRAILRASPALSRSGAGASVRVSF
jgi:hypothetical protein